MQVYGNCGRSAKYYGDELEVLRGLLVAEDHEPVYPSNFPEDIPDDLDEAA